LLSALRRRIDGLNRTSVGLKPWRRGSGWWFRMGLNRTSVGLKREDQAVVLLLDFRPQSNQRGIETTVGGSARMARTTPQSNQRGIETRNAI